MNSNWVSKHMLVYRGVRDYQIEHRSPPSERGLAGIVPYSRTNISRILVVLEELSIVRRAYGRARRMHILVKEDVALRRLQNEYWQNGKG